MSTPSIHSGWLGLSAGLALILAPLVVEASGIYKCVDASGRTTFSDSRCPGDSEESAVQRADEAKHDEISTPAGLKTVGSEYGARLWFEWWKVGGSVMEANFVVYNDNRYQIKDIEVECLHYGKSGTQIDRNVRTIYDVVPARARKGFTINMGFVHSQVTDSKCSIVSLQR